MFGSPGIVIGNKLTLENRNVIWHTFIFERRNVNVYIVFVVVLYKLYIDLGDFYLTKLLTVDYEGNENLNWNRKESHGSGCFKASHFIRGFQNSPVTGVLMGLTDSEANEHGFIFQNWNPVNQANMMDSISNWIPFCCSAHVHSSYKHQHIDLLCGLTPVESWVAVGSLFQAWEESEQGVRSLNTFTAQPKLAIPSFLSRHASPAGSEKCLVCPSQFRSADWVPVHWQFVGGDSLLLLLELSVAISGSDHVHLKCCCLYWALGLWILFVCWFHSCLAELGFFSLSGCPLSGPLSTNRNISSGRVCLQVLRSSSLRCPQTKPGFTGDCGHAIDLTCSRGTPACGVMLSVIQSAFQTAGPDGVELKLTQSRDPSWRVTMQRHLIFTEGSLRTQPGRGRCHDGPWRPFPARPPLATPRDRCAHSRLCVVTPTPAQRRAVHSPLLLGVIRVGAHLWPGVLCLLKPTCTRLFLDYM